MQRIKFVISLMKDSFSEFSEDNALKLSAALSYYTIFSLAPMLLLIISLASIFFGKEAFQGELMGQIGGLVGKQAAEQLQELIKNAAVTNKSTLAAVIGVITLVIGATGVFAEIQDSINYIWAIKSKPHKGWLAYLKNRLLSFSLIITLGFLLIVSLGVNAMVDVLSQRLERYFSDLSVLLFSALNAGLVLVIITALFTVVFKVLPDGHVRWKECFVGAIFTSILFAIGKFAISFYLGKSDLGASYGASASIIILLTWIYYSSIILYFGAEFTKVYARSDGKGITPNEHAVMVIRKEKETDDPTAPLKPEPQLADLTGAPARMMETINHFVDSKLALVRDEGEALVARLASPLAYYAILAVLGLVTFITLIIVIGHLINLQLTSNYLGYLIMLGICVVAVPALLFLGKPIKNGIRGLLFRIGQKHTDD